MKPTEAAALLTIAAVYDNRKPDADQAKAWAMALDGLRWEDCREVIVAHYQRTREWLMPVDIIRGVKRLRDKRISDTAPPVPPSWLDPDDSAALIRWERETRAAIADGTYEAPAPVALPQRDVIRELGQAGQSLDAREAMRKARERLQAAAAEEKRTKDQKRAAREAAREADRLARTPTTPSPRAEIRGRHESEAS